MTVKYYLVNSIGFFSQLFPSMVLYMLPFEESDFRFKRKYVFLIALLCGVATAAAFPFVMNSPLLGLFNSMTSFGSIYMLVVVIILVVAFGYILKTHAVKKSLCINLVVFYAATQYLLVNLIMARPSDDIMHSAYTVPQLHLYLATAAVLFPVMAWLLTRVIRPYFNEIEPENLKSGFHAIIAISLLAFVTMFIYTSVLSFTDRSFYWVFCPPFLLISVVMIAFYWLMFRESVRRKRENEYLRYAKVQEVQYQKLQREIENDARLRHDSRHHYRVLYEMALDSRDKEAQAYLAELLDQVTRRETERYCQNQTINALLQFYINWAKDENIDCEVQAVCGELAISSVDISTILGNTLENAIHACRKLSGRRWLSVKLGIVGSVFAMQIENSCGGVSLQKGYAPEALLPAEAFESGGGRIGYGLESISITAQRNGGEAQFCYSEREQKFITRVRLNPHGE